MKTKKQKQKEALERSLSYTYENSKAKRRGEDQSKWLKNKEKHEKRLQAKVR